MKLSIYYFAILIIALNLFFGCKKKSSNVPVEEPPPVTTPSNLPEITTLTVSSITEFSAQCGGKVTSEGASAITKVGICWDTNPSPTTLRSITNNGAGVGTYTSFMSGLQPGTKYYVRAYATNGNGTAYGNEFSFETAQAWTACYTSTIVGGVFMLGSTVIAATANDAVIVSTDSGVNWHSATSGLTNTLLTSIAVEGSTLFAGSYGGGVFVSTDIGNSWVARNTGLSSLEITSLSIEGNNIVLTTSYSKCFVSNDLGLTWTNKPNSLNLVKTKISNNIVYGICATISGDSIYRSTDFGNSWQPCANYVNNYTINDMCVSGNTVYIIGNSGLHKSTDNGASWTTMLSIPQGVFSMYIYNNIILACGKTLDKFYISTDSGLTFKNIKNGSVTKMPYNCATDGKFLYAAHQLGLDRFDLK